MSKRGISRLVLILFAMVIVGLVISSGRAAGRTDGVPVVCYTTDPNGMPVQTIAWYRSAPRRTDVDIKTSESFSDVEEAAEALAQVPEILWPIVHLQARAILEADEGL